MYIYPLGRCGSKSKSTHPILKIFMFLKSWDLGLSNVTIFKILSALENSQSSMTFWQFFRKPRFGPKSLYLPCMHRKIYSSIFQNFMVFGKSKHSTSKGHQKKKSEYFNSSFWVHFIFKDIFFEELSLTNNGVTLKYHEIPF